MAKPIILFYRKVRFFLKYLFLTLAIILLITWGHGKLGNSAISPVFASTPPKQLEIQANSLTNEGHRLLALGEDEEALKRWEEAMKLYEELGNKEGVIGSRINQSIALQALGKYRRACQVLLPALNIESQDNICDASSESKLDISEQSHNLISAIALRTFGDALRNVGKLDKSVEALQKSLQIAQDYKSDVDISAALLSLGNTERNLYKIKQNLYERTELHNDLKDSINFVNQSLQNYQKSAKQSFNIASLKNTHIQAKLNQLSLLLEVREWLKKEAEKDRASAKEWLPKIQSQILPIVDELLSDKSLFSDLLTISGIQARLNFAESLSKLQQNDKFTIAIQYTKEALQQAEELGNKRSNAYALGILGHLYEVDNKRDIAQYFTQKAVNIAKSIQAYDIVYQWEWQLGRIYKKQGNIKGAIAAYDSAVKDLDMVRKDLLSINPDVQFSFRDDVKPVYKELIDLLLQPEQNTSAPSQGNMEKVTDAIAQLQVAELENFLRCDLLNRDRKSFEKDPDIVPIEKLNKPPDAVIYMMVLEEQNKVEVIVSLPKRAAPPEYHNYSVSWNKVEFDVNTMRKILQSQALKPGLINDILPNAEALYKSLIKPAKTYLPEKGTLVFVLDSLLQNIPMAILHENQHYLVQDYSIAIAPSSQMREPNNFSFQEAGVLIAGISKNSPSFKKVKDQFDITFKPLPQVDTELTTVANTTAYNEKIADEEFTGNRFKNELQDSALSVIHIATHGQFSSDPESTFILAYDDLINIKQLDSLVRAKTEVNLNTIDLLVLSACQTAKGDKRGTLGLAGVAVQAGARSTVASLWNVSDKSTAFLMSEFYQALKKGYPKAEALRQAQIAILRNPSQNPDYNNYDNPYHWAPFILVGNWL